MAAALAVATLLKVSLEAVAKTFVQHDRPTETLPDVILGGKAAAHGLNFPSGHARRSLRSPLWWPPISKAGGRSCPGPWALGPLAAVVCLSRVYLGAHFPLDVAAGAGLGMFIGGLLNLDFGVPRTARADEFR